MGTITRLCRNVDDSSKVGEYEDNIIEGQDDISCNPSLDTISHSFEAAIQLSMKKKVQGEKNEEKKWNQIWGYGYPVGAHL